MHLRRTGGDAAAAGRAVAGRWRAPRAAGGHRLRAGRRHHRRHHPHRRRRRTSAVTSSRIGEKSLFLALVLTMLTCLVLGMGIPTIPNYIITSSLAAPALLELGVPLIVSHMFVFYFGIMADLTPPVALAAFAASPIAKETRPEDRHAGDAGGDRRLRRAVHGGLLAGADAAGRQPGRRRSTSSSRRWWRSGCGAAPPSASALRA